MQIITNCKIKPKVTVGICVKNNASTIGEAIESVIHQDYPHESMEIVVVDGESKDETLFIVRDILKNTDLKSKIITENYGLGHARQVVVVNAKGDYIIWVDGDMTIPSNFVSELVSFMEGHPQVGIVKGMQSLDLGGNLLATLESHSRVAGKMTDFSSKKAFGKVLGTSGSAYRVRAIRATTGFDRNLRGYCEDWDAEIKVRKAGWLLCTTAYRYHDYERQRLTWKNLWRRYWLRGFYTHYFLHKYGRLVKHYRMFPPAAFVSGLLSASKLFKLTHNRAIFLLPLQHTFKMTAWYFGFIRGHIYAYQP